MEEQVIDRLVIGGEIFELAKEASMVMAKQARFTPSDLSMGHRLDQELKIFGKNLVSFFKAIEDKYNIKIPEEDVESLKGFTGVVDYVVGRMLQLGRNK